MSTHNICLHGEIIIKNIWIFFLYGALGRLALSACNRRFMLRNCHVKNERAVA